MIIYKRRRFFAVCLQCSVQRSIRNIKLHFGSFERHEFGLEVSSLDFWRLASSRRYFYILWKFWTPQIWIRSFRRVRNEFFCFPHIFSRSFGAVPMYAENFPVVNRHLYSVMECQKMCNIINCNLNINESIINASPSLPLVYFWCL